MKIKTSKLLAVLCTLAMLVATFIPMLTLSVSAADTEIVFNLGADGSASHVDGSSKTTYSETVDGYTLTLTNVSNFYTGARDAKGNSCIKLGASSKAGGFSFTVPADVTSVVICIGKYKSNATKITVNGTAYTLTKNSNDGAYDEITVDTSSTKTVTLTTVSGGYRAMVNTIKFIIPGSSEPDCEHTNTTTTTNAATCTTAGSTVVTCDDCGFEISNTPIAALGHNFTEFVETVERTQTTDGYDLYKCSRCDATEKQNIVAASGFVASFEVPNGATKPESTSGLTVTMPDEVTLPENSYKYSYVFVGWAMQSIDGETESAPTIYEAGESVTISEDTTFYAVYMYSFGDIGNPDNYKLHSGALTAGNYVIVYDKGAMKAAISSDRLSYETVEISDDTISKPDGSLIWTIEIDGDYVTIYNSTTGKYASGNGTKNKAALSATLDDYSKWTVSGTDTYDFANKGNQAKGVNYTLRRNSTYGFACYATSTGGALSLYRSDVGTGTAYYVTTPETVSTECEHKNQTTVTVEAECEKEGSTTVTCDDCDTVLSMVTIPATGHQNTTETTVEASCTVDGSITTTCDDCGATISTETLPAGHKFVDGVCTGCGEKLLDYSGRYYIATIRSSGNYFYMTSALGTGSTKRYQAVDSGLTELPASITAPESGYVFVLINNGDGTYCIQAEGVDGDNYLGWTSGNSGTLVVQDSAKKFTIETTDEGLFNIYFDDRYLSLNGTSGNDYFAFYAGTQKQDLTLIPVEESVEPETPAGEITGAQLELGTDLSLRYQITVAEGESYESFKMVFTLGEKTVEATTTDGKFKLDGIAPDQMDDTITATLYKGEEVVDTLEYSIKAYLETIVNGAEYSAEAKSLAEAILIYGAAAQKHQNDTNAPVTDKTPNVTDANKPESDLSMAQVADKIEGSSVSFKSVGVRFSHVNKLYVALENDLAYTVTVKVNGNNAEIVDGYVYTNAISPADFDEVYTFELYVDGTLYQTVEYSVNSYISAKWNDASGLAKALYNYELAFVAYINQ